MQAPIKNIIGIIAICLIATEAILIILRTFNFIENSLLVDITVKTLIFALILGVASVLINFVMQAGSKKK